MRVPPRWVSIRTSYEPRGLAPGPALVPAPSPLDAFRGNGLLLEDDGRPAHAHGFEVDPHLDPVGDVEEENVVGHPEVLPIEGHSPGNRARPSPFARDSQVQGLGLGDAANGKGARHIRGGAVLAGGVTMPTRASRQQVHSISSDSTAHNVRVSFLKEIS